MELPISIHTSTMLQDNKSSTKIVEFQSSVLMLSWNFNKHETAWCRLRISRLNSIWSGNLVDLEAQAIYCYLNFIKEIKLKVCPPHKGYWMVKERLWETLRQGIFLRARDTFSQIYYVFKIRDSEMAFCEKTRLQDPQPKFCKTLTFCGVRPFDTPHIRKIFLVLRSCNILSRTVGFVIKWQIF